MLSSYWGSIEVVWGEVSPDGKEFVVTHSYQLPGVPPSARLILHSQFPTFAGMIRQGKVRPVTGRYAAGGISRARVLSTRRT